MGRGLPGATAELGVAGRQDRLCRAGGGKCDTALWDLGQESSQRGTSGEAAESVTPLQGLAMAALRV